MSNTPTASASTPQMPADKGLVDNAESLLFSDILSDVTIVCGDERISAHRTVLYTQSEFFRKAFTVNMKEKLEGVITLPDDVDAIKSMLQYMYKKTVPAYADQSVRFLHLVHVWIVADKYIVPPLKSAVIGWLDQFDTKMVAEFHESFFAGINLMYKSTHENQDPARSLMVRLAHNRLHAKAKLEDNEQTLWKDLLGEMPQFAFDLAQYTTARYRETHIVRQKLETERARAKAAEVSRKLECKGCSASMLLTPNMLNTMVYGRQTSHCWACGKAWTRQDWRITNV